MASWHQEAAECELVFFHMASWSCRDHAQPNQLTTETGVNSILQVLCVGLTRTVKYGVPINVVFGRYTIINRRIFIYSSDQP